MPLPARTPLLALLLLGLLAGCGTPTKKLPLARLAELPVSQGSYGGSLWLRPWVYLGSDSRFHHLFYTYTRDNLAYRIRVLIPKAELSLPFEFSLVEAKGQVLEVFPVPAFFGGILTFSLTPGSSPKNLGWETYPPPLPSFDSKVEAPRLTP